MSVVWQVEMDGCNVIGCMFCHHTSYGKLMHLADAQDAKALCGSAKKLKFPGRNS